MKTERKEIEERVLDIVQEAYCMSGDEDVTLDSKLVDLGFDSLDYVELVMAVEEEFEFDVHDEDEDYKKLSGWSIKDLVDYVEGRLK